MACNNTKNITLTLNLSPTLTLNATTTKVCLGGSTTLTATGSNTGSYIWTAPGFTTVTNSGTLAVSPTATTTYTVTAPTSCGPATQEQITVYVPSLTAASNAYSICSGTPVTLSATTSDNDGATFTWHTGGATGLQIGLGSPITVTPTTGTTYTVVSSNPSGCANTISRDVSVTVITQTVTITPASAATSKGIPVTLTAVSNFSGATYTWTAPGMTTVTNTTGTLTVTPTATTTYTVTSAAGTCTNATKSATVTYTTYPLPVQLMTFTARGAGPVSVLNWATATEYNNDYFAVERSADGLAFALLGQVAGAGTSSSLRSYSFTDERPPVAVAYYRLRQVDYVGAATYSPVVSVTSIRHPGDWLVRTALARHYLIQGALDASSRFTVLDVMGRNVFGQAVAPDRAEVVIPALPAGVYLFQLSTQQGRFTVRQSVTAAE